MNIVSRFIVTALLVLSLSVSSYSADYSRVSVTATAGQTSFIVAFADGLIDQGTAQDTVEIYVNDILNSSASITWTSPTTVELAGYVPEAGDVIQFRRITEKDSLFVNFTAGTKIRTTTLDLNLRQLLHATHEALDVTVDTEDINDAVAAAAVASEAASEAAAASAASAASINYHTLDTLADLKAYTGSATTIYVRGRASVDDGGQGVFIKKAGDFTAKVTADTLSGVYAPSDSDPTGASGCWVRIDKILYPDQFGTGSSAFTALSAFNIFSKSVIKLLPKTYTVSGALTLTIDNMIGSGWVYNDDTSSLLGSIVSSDNSITFNYATDVRRGFRLSDTGFNFSGATAGIVVDDYIYNDISRLFIECNNTATIGLTLNNWGFFTNVHDVLIQRFTDTGILITGDGTKHVIRDMNISSGVTADANYGIETRNPGTSIYDGQSGVARADKAGVGVYFHNTGASNINGGLVQGTLFEDDYGIKIDGDTHFFGSIVARNTRHTVGSGQTAIVFGRAYLCKLENPTLSSPVGGYVAEWGANSVKCGVVGNYDACRSGVRVDVSATDAYMICTSPLTYAERSDISTDTNLTVTCEDVQYVGRTIHNGTSWDKFSESVADDGFTTITPPSTIGNITIRTTNGGAEYAVLNYNVSTGVLADILSAGGMEIITSDGTLDGTTGTDGFLVVRASSTGEIYIENRRGGSRRFIAEFK